MIELSIIIVSFNTKKLLKKCLESLVVSLQSSAISIEIVVVDNGSNDGSQTVIKSIKSKVESQERKFILIENKQNLGFATAVNQALRQVLGKTVLLLNSDAKVKMDTLEKLLQFERKVGPAIIGARMLNSDGSVQASVFHLPTIRRAIEEYWLGKKGNFSKYFPLEDKPREVEAVSGGAMLISRPIFEKIGFLDERYFFYYEDLDFCRRARKDGFKIWYLPTSEVIHEHGASGKDLASPENQWKRLVPSSKIFNGRLKYWLITFVIKIGRIIGTSET